MCARERLYSQMDSLMSLQVVVSVEALRTLVTLEGSVVRRLLLVGRRAKEMRHARSVSAVESGHHTGMNPANQR
jgi:hypothetical protein